MYALASTNNLCFKQSKIKIFNLKIVILTAVKSIVYCIALLMNCLRVFLMKNYLQADEQIKSRFGVK